MLKKTAAILGILALTACETADDNSTERARACGDRAMKLALTNAASAAAEAATCETYVANVNTAEGGRVGFMLTLIKQQKIAQLSQAATALTGSSNTIGTSMSYLAYTAYGSNSATTEGTNMYNYAVRSGSTGVLKLAALIQVATIANAALAITLGNNASVASAIAAITPGSQQETDAATAILALQTSACSGSDSTSSECTKITQAIGGATTPAAILLNVKNAIQGGI